MGLPTAFFLCALCMGSMATVTKLIIAKPLEIESLETKTQPVYADRGPHKESSREQSYGVEQSSNVRKPSHDVTYYQKPESHDGTGIMYVEKTSGNKNGRNGRFGVDGKQYVMMNKGLKSHRKMPGNSSNGKGRSTTNQNEMAIIAIPIKIESKGIKGIMNGKSVQTMMGGVHSYDMANYKGFKGASYETSYDQGEADSSNYDGGGSSGRMNSGLYEEIQGSSPNVLEVDKESPSRGGYEVVKIVKSPSQNVGYQVVREVKEPVIQVVKEIVKENAAPVKYQVVKEVVKGNSHIFYEMEGDAGKTSPKVKYQIVSSDGDDDKNAFGGDGVTMLAISKGKGGKQKNNDNQETDDERKGPMNPHQMMHMMKMMGMRPPMYGPNNMNNMMKMKMMQAMMMQMRNNPQAAAMMSGSQPNMGMRGPPNMRGMHPSMMTVQSSPNMMNMMKMMSMGGGYSRRPNMMSYGSPMKTSASMMSRSPFISPLMRMMRPPTMPSLPFPFRIPMFTPLSANPRRLAAAVLGATGLIR